MFRFQVAPEAWKIIIPFWLILFVLGLVLSLIPGVRWFVPLLLPLAFFGLYFFRDPEREIPQKEGVVVSPADGTVIDIREVSDGPYVSTPHRRISIFMSVFNVHINRAPVAGEVKKVVAHPGRFRMAMVDKASLDNEQTAVYLAHGSEEVIFVQIAGFIARRIINHLRVGEKVSRGARYGLICFGSRVDIYLPLRTKIVVQKGEKTRAGETVIGELFMGRDTL